ncbi:CdaR family transcriptional regulator [Neobacillus mesonae]|uniref:CdaR family transcriptional regulator n=1 Tax=Neobacillus mesonae TaxID=1193713 RepID=UPI002E2015A1|nr:sugar diacid recognition domain-containing protein [Neobacillus mesonae]
MLTQEMAAEIVEQTMIRLHRNINIMNDKGVIIASGNQNRLYQIHSGALEVLKSGKPLIIHDENMQQWEGSLPGINLPITFQDDIIGVIGITGDPEEIMEFGELVKMITEMMIQQSFMAEQLEWKQRLKEQVFGELLKEHFHEDSIKQRLSLIEVTLAPPFQAAVLDLGLTPLKKKDIMQIFADTFHEAQSLIGYLTGNRIFVLTSNLAEAKLKQKLTTVLGKLNSSHLRIGIGLPVLDYTHIRHSYHEALQALQLGSSEQHLITFSEIETKALLTSLDERSKLQYIERILGPLSDKFIETLDHFFKNNQNIGECAKSMYIHRNSLVYRLKKIRELTGLDPQRLNDAVPLQLAVWLWEMDRNKG